MTMKKREFTPESGSVDTYAFEKVRRVTNRSPKMKISSVASYLLN